MSTGKKFFKSRTRRARRKRDKFVTPDLALVSGKLMRFVAGPDCPLIEAERLLREYAKLDKDHDAAIRQFLQLAYFLVLEFRWRWGDFERFQVHPFWKQLGQKPKDPSTSKWVLLFIMQPTTPDECNRADKYTLILDGLKQKQVEPCAVAARIKELGGIEAAYETMRVRTAQHKSCATPNSQSKRLPMATTSMKLARPTIRKAKRTDEDRPNFDGDAVGPGPGYYIDGLFKQQITSSLLKPPRRPRKLNDLDRLSRHISETEAQLRQARTKEERDFLTKKIRVLEHLLQDRAAKMRQRRLTARASKAAARWERMNSPR